MLKLFFVRFCLFVCLFVPYTNPHFWTTLKQTLHTSPPSSGRDRRVCMVRKCLTLFYLFNLLRRERVQTPGHNMAARARHFRHSVISVILAGVSVTSRCSRRHLPTVIRDSVISVILAGFSVASRKWCSCRRHLLRVIRDSVISAILAGISVMSRKWRCSGRHLRILTGSGLWVMHKERREVNGMHMCKMETL